MVALFILAMFGIFGRGRHDRYQFAYEQGFLDGQQVAASGDKTVPDGAAVAEAPVPESNPGTLVFYRGQRFFFPAFGLFLCLLPLLFMGMMFAGFNKRRWHGHHKRGHWGHGRRGYGPCGPRRWESDDNGDVSQKEKSPDDIDDGPSDEPIFRA